MIFSDGTPGLSPPHLRLPTELALLNLSGCFERRTRSARNCGSAQYQRACCLPWLGR